MMSREILVFIAGSLDGFIAKENDDLQWLEETEGEGDNGYADMYQTIDTVIMGKRTYDYILEHMEPFPYPDKKCYVFSRTRTGENEHVTFIQGRSPFSLHFSLCTIIVIYLLILK